MSYLNFPRLTFSGEFQADISTVNNDPRHFDNSTFEPEFQEFQQGSQYNGWWNPIGTGIFRLSGCKVNTLLGPDGIPVTDPALDAALNCVVGNSPDRPSGKLVDLDPDWQLASCIYGFSVSLADENGKVVMQGNYQPNPFRDLWFSRAPAPVPGDSAASAMFQSVLTDVKWHEDAMNSPFFKELIKASERAQLSIRLTTYAFTGDKSDPKFMYGKVVGVIGPAYTEEPNSFILGRRFMPTTQNAAQDMISGNGITCFSSIIDKSTNTLQLDFSNALPTDADFRIQNLGMLEFAVLINPLTAQDTQIGPDGYCMIGALDCSEALQNNLSGIQSLAIPDAARALIHDHPLALIQILDERGNASVCIREALLGLEVRPDQFAFRLDPNDASANQFETTFHAARYGIPMKDAELEFWFGSPVLDYGNTPASEPADMTPKALLPVNNVPAQVVKLVPERPVTDKHGKVKVKIHGPRVMGTPREYFDGQLYIISYNFAGKNPAVQQTYDKVVAVVFSTFDAPEKPNWADVQPILQQYANLYPVMSHGLFDFSKQAQADANARILHFVFNKHFDDPDYMPVTRDLSSSKRKMLLSYFAGVMAANGQISDTQQIYTGRCPMGFIRKPSPQDIEAGLDSVTSSKLRSKR